MGLLAHTTGGIYMTNQDYEKIFHEIKNNITFINSSLQLVEKSHPEIKSYPHWEDSIQELSSLKQMLIELSSARLYNDLNTEKISLEIFLPELIRSFLSLFDSDSFHCRIALEPSLPQLYIDPHRFKRALFNLVKNSYEAMNGTGTIRLNGCISGSFIRLDLIDCGGGIASEYLPKLFSPFETTKEGGTGLGLLISKQMIEAHGGKLLVDSRPGDGCTFSIYLPCG